MSRFDTLGFSDLGTGDGVSRDFPIAGKDESVTDFAVESVRRAGWQGQVLMSPIPRTNYASYSNDFTRPEWSGSPSLLLGFQNQRYFVVDSSGALQQKPFSDIITFTRASGGGRFNAQGQYEWLPADTPRIDYDPVTGECRGLLIEESRTNLLRRSDNFSHSAWQKASGVVIAADDVVAPNGSIAHRIDLVGAGHNIQQNVSALSVGMIYTLSVWVRPKTTPFPLQLAYYDGINSLNAIERTPEAGKWTRLSYTFTPTVAPTSSAIIRLIGFGNGNNGDSLYIWGAQLEQGSFPTSYIPTEGAQVTRAADIATVNDLAPWYNSGEGTLFVEWAHNSELVPAGTAQYVVGLFDGNAVTNFVNIQRNASEIIQGLSSVGGVDQGAIDAKLAADTRSHRAAMSVSAAGRYISVDGSSTLTGPQTAMPVFDRMFIGNRWDAVRAINGHIRSLRYFPRALSSAELQAITA